ncbi:hypothetical protein OG195_27370 [Streptomyces sp. NBC_01362]|uniref:hypothetical protein n=1 Tax=Streptomyces sp. NBC_01362 TaxID=2903839 RepID=UPI002E37B1F3|nr:hypothetical protein [Streptomyces sp. NBC_01362]
MRTHKAFAALGSALFVGSLAFAPALTSQASAAPKPSQAIAAQDVLANPYRDGYRQGFRVGFADAKDDCARESGVTGQSNQGYGQAQRDYDFTRGYGDGYESGYSRAYDRFC